MNPAAKIEAETHGLETQRPQPSRRTWRHRQCDDIGPSEAGAQTFRGAQLRCDVTEPHHGPALFEIGRQVLDTRLVQREFDLRQLDVLHSRAVVT